MSSTPTSSRCSTDSAGLARLDEAACWEILARNEVGRIGLTHRRRPVIFPVNYVVDGREIVFRSGLGTKLTAATLHRPVVFEVDEFDSQFRRGVSVMVHGWLHEIVEPEELRRVRRLPLRPWADGDRDRFLRVHSGRVTGRGIGVALQNDSGR